MTREERNKILRNQTVLTGRVFNSRIFHKTGMVELVEYARHQGWLHLLEELIFSIFEEEVRKFQYTMNFSDDRLKLTSLV